MSVPPSIRSSFPMLTADGLLEGQTADTDAERRCHDFPHRQEINRFVAAAKPSWRRKSRPKISVNARVTRFNTTYRPCRRSFLLC